MSNPGPLVVVERLSGIGALTRNGEQLGRTPYVIVVRRAQARLNVATARTLVDLELPAFPPSIDLGITVTLHLEDGRGITIYRTAEGYEAVGGFTRPEMQRKISSQRRAVGNTDSDRV
jgi:hypothetical protein